MSDSNIFFAVIATILVFLVIRDLICWYWKINAQVQLLQEIRNELKTLNKNSDTSEKQ